MAKSWRFLAALSALWLAALIWAVLDHQWLAALGSGVLLAMGAPATALRWRWSQPRPHLKPAGHPRRMLDLRVDPSGPTCTLSVRRRRPGSAQARRFKVLLDGSVVARLWLGQAVLFQLDPGPHHLQTAMSRRWHSEVVDFDALPGQDWTADILVDDLATVMQKRDKGDLTWKNANAASPMRLDLRAE